MRHLARWWAVLVLPVGAVAAEWLREPSALWVIAAWVAGAGAVAALSPWSGWRRRALAAALAGLCFGLAAAHWQLRTVETSWEGKRAGMVESASTALRRSLCLRVDCVQGC